MNTFRIEKLYNEESADTAALLMEGELVINQVQAAKERIAEVLTSPKIKITLQQVTNLDLSFIQLLLATQHTARQLGKGLWLQAVLPYELLTIVKNAGFEKLFSPIESA